MRHILPVCLTCNQFSQTGNSPGQQFIVLQFVLLYLDVDQDLSGSRRQLHPEQDIETDPLAFICRLVLAMSEFFPVFSVQATDLQIRVQDFRGDADIRIDHGHNLPGRIWLQFRQHLLQKSCQHPAVAEKPFGVIVIESLPVTVRQVQGNAGFPLCHRFPLSSVGPV